MSDPQRLFSGALSDVERDMLRAWEAEQPSAEAHAKARAIAGLALGGALVATSGATATKGLAAAGGSIAPKAALLGGALGKWVVLVAIGVAGAGLTAAFVTRSPAPATSPQAIHSFDIHEAMSAWNGAPDPPPTPVRDESSAPRTPVAAPLPPSRAHVPATHAASPAHSASLGEQVASLDRARAAMQEGDPALAERRVDEFEASFPGGSLREEAEALRVDALASRGDGPAARRAATRFLATYPASVHARRFRTLVGAGTTP